LSKMTMGEWAVFERDAAACTSLLGLCETHCLF
jgi:hypothetical protein